MRQYLIAKITIKRKNASEDLMNCINTSIFIEFALEKIKADREEILIKQRTSEPK